MSFFKSDGYLLCKARDPFIIHFYATSDSLRLNQSNIPRHLENKFQDHDFFFLLKKMNINFFLRLWILSDMVLVEN